MSELLSELVIFRGFGDVLLEVLLALVPLVIFFMMMQVFYLKLPMVRLKNILMGMVLTFIGLTLFLQGVHVGFEPAGRMMGMVMGDLPYRWVLIPIGFVLGFVATIAEPAIRILNHEVDKVSGGYIPQTILLYTLAIGVGLAIALAMARVLLGFPLIYVLLPGYVLVLLLTLFSTPTFTAVAFDSGGVATGPMTVTFIMAIALGVGEIIEGRDPLVDSFGMIALVALAPILSVLVLGFLYAYKERRNG